MITASLTRAFADDGIAAPDRTGCMSIVGLSLVDAMAALTPDEDRSDPSSAWAPPTSRPSGISALSGAHPEDLFDGAQDLLAKTCGRAATCSSASPPASRAAASPT